jgi:hypothetical protein
MRRWRKSLTRSSSHKRLYARDEGKNTQKNDLLRRFVLFFSDSVPSLFIGDFAVLVTSFCAIVLMMMRGFCCFDAPL